MFCAAGSRHARMFSRSLGLTLRWCSAVPPATLPPLVRPRVLAWEDLVAPSAVIEELQETLLQSAHANRFRAIQARTRGRPRDGAPNRALLLAGPPGTGKTFAAEVIAAVGGRPMFRLAAEHFRTRWHGESEKSLHELLSAVSRAGPCVLFIDEFDTVAHVRRGQVGDAEIAVLLEFMDGIVRERASQCIVIAATNLPERVDAAVRSRMRLVMFPSPDKTSALQWWKLNARHLCAASWATLAQQSLEAGVPSFRDMEKVSRSAEATAARRDVADAEEVLWQDSFQVLFPAAIGELEAETTPRVFSDPHSPVPAGVASSSLAKGPSKRIQQAFGSSGWSAILELSPASAGLAGDVQEGDLSGQLALFLAKDPPAPADLGMRYKIAIGAHERSFVGKPVPEGGVGWRSFCPLADVRGERRVTVTFESSERVQLPVLEDYTSALARGQASISLQGASSEGAQAGPVREAVAAGA